MAYQERRITSVDSTREVLHDMDEAHDNHQWAVTTTLEAPGGQEIVWGPYR